MVQLCFAEVTVCRRGVARLIHVIGTTWFRESEQDTANFIRIRLDSTCVLGPAAADSYSFLLVVLFTVIFLCLTEFVKITDWTSRNRIFNLSKTEEIISMNKVLDSFPYWGLPVNRVS